MKKTICLIICTLIITSILVGCNVNASMKEGKNEFLLNYTIIEVETAITNEGRQNRVLMYDNNTLILYVYTRVYQAGDLTPYYIIGEDGCVHMAQYINNQIVEIPNPFE